VRARVFNRHTFEITGHGSLDGAASALDAVATQVRKAINGKPGVRLRAVFGGGHALARPQGNAAHTGALVLRTTFKAVSVGVFTVCRKRSALSCAP